MGSEPANSQDVRDKIASKANPFSLGEACAAWERLLAFIGDDPGREGLLKTPYRIIKSWQELFAGYLEDAKSILNSATFEDGCCDEMVILKEVTGYSMCEHHFLPFSFRAHVGYIPSGRVVGVSKLARVVECFSRRLQLQEKMTSQIADAIMEALTPKGVMVVVEGVHLCMLCRGVRQHDSSMVTSAIRGAFQDESPRSEFLQLIKN